VLEQFERYQQDPAQVEDADLRAYFERLVPFSASARPSANERGERRGARSRRGALSVT
jgi:hypothetical protein